MSMTSNEHARISAASDLARSLPIACSLGNRELAERAERIRQELFAGAEERRELADGYAFRFAGTGPWGDRIAEFIGSERQCCTFFRFEVGYEPNSGPIWLCMTGPDGTRAFIEGLLGD